MPEVDELRFEELLPEEPELEECELDELLPEELLPEELVLDEPLLDELLPDDFDEDCVSSPSSESSSLALADLPCFDALPLDESELSELVDDED